MNLSMCCGPISSRHGRQRTEKYPSKAISAMTIATETATARTASQRTMAGLFLFADTLRSVSLGLPQASPSRLVDAMTSRSKSQRKIPPRRIKIRCGLRVENIKTA